MSDNLSLGDILAKALEKPEKEALKLPTVYAESFLRHMNAATILHNVDKIVHRDWHLEQMVRCLAKVCDRLGYTLVKKD